MRREECEADGCHDIATWWVKVRLPKGVTGREGAGGLWQAPEVRLVCLSCCRMIQAAGRRGEIEVVQARGLTTRRRRRREQRG